MWLTTDHAKGVLAGQIRTIFSTVTHKDIAMAKVVKSAAIGIDIADDLLVTTNGAANQGQE